MYRNRNIKFTKMQGAGNDYIYIDALSEAIQLSTENIVRLSNRNFGIGSDGVVLILPSTNSDFRMQMFNSDGSEAEMCGNASRCIAKYVYDKGITTKKEITLETKAGIKSLTVLEGDSIRREVRVDMGEPILTPKLIPANINKNPILKHPITIDSKTWEISCVSMGNPHAVVFTTNIGEINLWKIGSLFEKNTLFPRGINTEFVEIINRLSFNMRVWERGAGETLACGTGACAATVAAILNDLCNRKVKAHLPGGYLDIEWSKSDNHVYMTGDAVTVFEGVVYI